MPAHLHTAGGHLRWLIVDGEAVPSRRQGVVAYQVLDGCVLELGRVKVNAPVRVPQDPISAGVTLRSWQSRAEERNVRDLCGRAIMRHLLTFHSRWRSDS